MKIFSLNSFDPLHNVTITKNETKKGLHTILNGKLTFHIKRMLYSFLLANIFVHILFTEKGVVEIRKTIESYYGD